MGGELKGRLGRGVSQWDGSEGEVVVGSCVKRWISKIQCGRSSHVAGPR